MWSAELNQDILERLQNDYGLKGRGDYLRGGKCPKCSKKELFIKREEPHHLKCGREDKCGWGSNTRDLYPDLFKPLHERHPPTPADPHATAKAYLRERGLDPVKFRAEFVQGSRYEPEALREPKGTQTLKFHLPEKVEWERFITVIDMPDKPKKAHFTGHFKGLWWQPSDFNPERGDQVFLVEGIIDALSLIQSGFMAVSLMSCNNWPEKSLEPYLGRKIRWVLALDNDKAGQRYNRQFFRKLENRGETVEVCTAPDQDKRDFNDLLKDCHGKIRRHDLDDWFYAGRLLTAPNAQAKALEIVNHTHKHYFTFDFADQLYHAKYSEKEGEEPIQVTNIANCKPEFLYFQQDILSEDNSAYYFRVNRPGNKQVYQGVFSASALSSEKEFNQRLLNLGAGLMFTGTKKQLQRHSLDYWFNSHQPTEVKTINYLGYSPDMKGWLFPKRAVFDGKLHNVNKDDFVDLPDGRQVKTAFRLATIQIGTVDDAHKPDLWLDDFRKTFGVRGLATLAAWTGAFFVQQIREKQGFYHFLELSGDHGTGKTKLLEFLWKLSGRDNYEGVELSKATNATRWRSLEQLANLPLVMIEGDRSDQQGHQKRTFDLNEIKPLYNGRGMRGTSPKNQGIETKEPPFRGSVIIAQNAPVDSDPAVLSRIVRIHWDNSHFSSAGKMALDRLRALDMDKINGYMTACITQEKLFMEKYLNGYQFALKKLKADESLGSERLVENHAQIMAVAHALKATGILGCLLTSDLEDIDTYLKTCCKQHHQLLEGDSPLIEQFWDTYHYLVGQCGCQLNHSKTPDQKIAINMEHFREIAQERGQAIPDLIQLKKELKNGKRYPFEGRKNVKSAIQHKGRGQAACFVFTNTDPKIQTVARAA